MSVYKSEITRLEFEQLSRWKAAVMFLDVFAAAS